VGLVGLTSGGAGVGGGIVVGLGVEHRVEVVEGELEAVVLDGPAGLDRDGR